MRLFGTAERRAARRGWRACDRRPGTPEQPKRGAILHVGLGVLCLDMPGTGEAPIKIDIGAENMYSSAIDYLLTRPDVDGKRLAAMGVSECSDASICHGEGSAQGHG